MKRTVRRRDRWRRRPRGRRGSHARRRSAPRALSKVSRAISGAVSKRVSPATSDGVTPSCSDAAAGVVRSETISGAAAATWRRRGIGTRSFGRRPAMRWLLPLVASLVVVPRPVVATARSRALPTRRVLEPSSAVPSRSWYVTTRRPARRSSTVAFSVREPTVIGSVFAPRSRGSLTHPGGRAPDGPSARWPRPWRRAPGRRWRRAAPGASRTARAASRGARARPRAPGCGA
jgi:hypothetical protein